VDAEHERFKKHEVWRPVLRSEIPQGAKVLLSTWVMKQKADGTNALARMQEAMSKLMEKISHLMILQRLWCIV
jgi:hypothetical protein